MNQSIIIFSTLGFYNFKLISNFEIFLKPFDSSQFKRLKGRNFILYCNLYCKCKFKRWHFDKQLHAIYVQYN